LNHRWTFSSKAISLLYDPCQRVDSLERSRQPCQPYQVLESYPHLVSLQARTAANRSQRHVLVNIQNPQSFDSQTLNRDVWKNELVSLGGRPGRLPKMAAYPVLSHESLVTMPAHQVKEVIRGQFIFWQQYESTPAAQQYRSWYPFTEVPHIAIISGETGPYMRRRKTLTTSHVSWLLGERILVLPAKTTPEIFLERGRLPHLPSPSRPS
jgi:hypothetical protein